MSNITLFPHWKANATPAERLRELADMAELSPERFELIIIGWSGQGPEDGESFTTSYASAGKDLSVLKLIGLIELVKNDMVKNSGS